jgi:tetratricopeptide (TPR) repeat protein
MIGRTLVCLDLYFNSGTNRMLFIAWRERFGSLLSKAWFRCFCLAVAGFAVHLPSLQGQFLWDDGYLAQENPFIKSPLLIFQAFRHFLFHDSFSGYYRPVQNLSFMVDYYLWNNDAAGFHLTNLVLHVASGLLLYRLLTCLLKEFAARAPQAFSSRTASTLAWLTAAVWIVHPVHSAAVDYVSGRADSLAFALASGAWLLVNSARKAGPVWLRVILYLFAALAGFLALCSREIACIWIVLFLAHSLFFSPKLSRKARVLTVGCSLLLIAGYAAARHFAQGQAAPSSASWAASFRVTLMLRALGDYARLMIFPANLHMERSVFNPDNFMDQRGWRQNASWEYLGVLGAMAAIIFAWGCLRRGRGQAVRIFGAVWFFAGYLPISNLFMVNATVAEHWLYLPSVGFLIFIVGFIVEASPKLQRGIAVAAVLVIAALGTRAWVRSTDWHDDATFFQHTVAAGGISARTIVNLALANSNRGHLDVAERALRRAVQVWPDYPLARNNLANVLLKRGKTNEAEEFFKVAAKAGKEYPRTWVAYLNVAFVRTSKGDDAGAIEVLERARAEYPGVWDLISRESELLRRTQGPQVASRLVEDFVRQNPWHFAASLAAGKLRAELNDSAGAATALRHAALLDLHDTQALDLLAQIYVRQNDLVYACQAQRRAVNRQPDHLREYFLLAEILEKMGRKDDAQATLAKASCLRDMATAQPPLATVIN